MGLIRGSSTSNPNATRVLRFRQADASHSFHGLFWPRGEDLGKFLWDAWVKPRETGYLVSDGYGGGHALLWGWNNSLPGPQHGNVWTGAATASFTGRYSVAVGEWVHAQVIWDGTNLYTYINGVCDSKQAFAGPRQSGSTSSDGFLYVGGSDHLNGGFDLAMVRAWDRLSSHFYTAPMTAFIPDRLPGRWHSSDPSDDETACDFLCDYTQGGPSQLIDSSPRGVSHTSVATDRVRHHGRLFTTLGDTTVVGNFGLESTRAPLPKWVIDNTCPFGRDYTSPLPNETIPTPGSAPSGARLFDSFGRRNQTYAFQGITPTLGSTESSGSLGAVAWTIGNPGGGAGGRPAKWGILGGYAVQIASGITSLAAWVEAGVANQDVRITRDTSALGNKEVGLAFRVVDGNNFWQAYFDSTNKIRIGNWVDVSFTLTATIDPDATSTTWTILRVWCSGNTIRVYVDDGAGGFTQVGSDITDATHNSATKAGMAGSDAIAGNSLARYKNFTVLTAV